ncbi:MAG: DUF2807 domain-containing protein [Defluviitaleaceae bacterium]|nr:DUF2807 domain-containing protein [Defluviitaleaceae bacterium]
MKKFCMAVLIFTALALFAGCVSANPGVRSVRGRGNMETHTIRATGFTGLHISGGYELVVGQADSFSVNMYIQSNLFEFVEAEVRDGVLYISSTRNFNTGARNTPRLYVNAPDLNSIFVQGAVDADIVLDVATLEIDVAGAANVILAGGRAETLSISIAGAANVEAFNFTATHATVNVAGAGNADIYATDTLNVSIAGVGSVRYDGGAEVTRSVAGLGTVRRR